MFFVGFFSDETTIDESNRNLQEIADCHPASEIELSNKAFNASYLCHANAENNVASTRRKTRFCVTCSLNIPQLRYHQHKLDYVLQLSKITRGGGSATVGITFNLTGVPAIESDERSETGFSGLDYDDYYVDPEDHDNTDVDRGDYSHDTRNVVQKVMFVIDDKVDPGIYRGKIYNNGGGTVSAIVKGTINVASMAFGDVNENNNDDYIYDDSKIDTGTFYVYWPLGFIIIH